MFHKPSLRLNLQTQLKFILILE